MRVFVDEASLITTQDMMVLLPVAKQETLLYCDKT